MIKVINVYKDTRVMEMTTGSNIGLGVHNDNEIDLLRFTFDDFINGTATLLTDLKDSHGELVAFPLTINQDEKSYDLEITQAIVSEPYLTFQIEIAYDTDKIWHSKQATLQVDDCLEIGEGEMPTTIENWLENANLVLADMQQATTEAENVNIEVEHVGEAYEVTFTDRNGNQTEATIQEGHNAIISGASATINNQVGTPSVSVTMGGTEYDRTFSFAFENLKGEQGEQGEQGEPGQIKFEIVEELPTTEIEEDTIYLVPITPDTEENNYAEYIYVNGEWELLGKIGVHVDLTNYVTKTDYASQSTGGVIKTDLVTHAYGITENGQLTVSSIPYSSYSSLSDFAFIGKGTLDNVLNAKIGDINSVLDAINGEVI